MQRRAYDAERLIFVGSIVNIIIRTPSNAIVAA